MSGLVVLLALLFAATGATAAVAVVAASRLELTRWVARRLAGAEAATTLLARPGDIASVANGMVALGVVVAGAAAPWALRDAGITLTLALELGFGMPALLLVVYFLPRAVGRRWPEPLVRALVPRLKFAARYVGWIVRGRAATERADLSALFRDSTSAGLAREDELEIVTGVMAFAERSVREIMTPRTRIVAAREGTSAAELTALVSASGYTRIPLYRGSLDEIIGMVHAFDLIKAGESGEVTVRPVAVVPATRCCADALLDLKRERRHLAVVTDEFGGTAGIITMEDLLEELVGEIFDELDEPQAARPAGAPGVLVIEAGFPLSRVAEHFGIELQPPPRVETAGGYLAWAAGRIPQPGERLIAGGLEWDVVEGTAAKLGRLVVRIPSPRGG
ncbi:MAG TPA: hemolysin family protein [Gemmatimonadales bacterium]|nr:hemolysin family protein [Gemmatimonadales bacterium]